MEKCFWTLSRQIQLFLDRERSNVMLVGSNALVAEIAKNLVLCQAAKLIIVDDGSLIPADQESAPFLNGDAQPSSQTFATRIASYVQKSSTDTHITISVAEAEDLLKNGDVRVAVFANLTQSELRTYNGLCRNNGIKFIAVSSNGLACQIFCDFGAHSYEDRSGTFEKDECINEIKEIVREGKGLFRVELIQNNWPHLIRQGDSVYFTTSSVGSITDQCPKLEVLSADHRLSTLIVRTNDFASIKDAKYVKKIPRVINMQFRSLEEFVNNPPAIDEEDNFNKLAWLVYLAKCRSESDKTDLFEQARLLHQELEGKIEVEFDENPVKNIISHWNDSLPPVVSFIGAIAANEVMKATSGRYKPIEMACYSWPNISSPTLESLPSTRDDTLFNPLQRSIIGKLAQDKLKNLKVLLVGAGALGCELMKLLVAMGVATEKQGHITVVDFDRIEPSNLHRQFFFKAEHRGQFKSEVLVHECKKMNPNIDCTAYTHKLDKQDITFSDEFYENLDVIIGAVDSFDAREYLCKQAQTYGKPFLEAGTEGMIGCSSVFVHGKTDLYRAPPKQPVTLGTNCTAKSYPTKFSHCVQWALMRFHETFFDMLSVYEQHSKDPSKTHKSHTQMLEAFSSFLVNHDTEATVRFFFESWFTNKLQDIPVKDATAGVFDPVTNDLHLRFMKKFCAVLAERPINDLPTQFDKDNILHLELISIAARIYAEIFGTDTVTDSVDDLYRVQIMAATITPAIITTTAAMASLCALQLYKLVADLPISAYDFYDCNFAYNDVGVSHVDDSTTFEYPYLELDPISESMTVKDFAQLFTTHLQPNESIKQIEIRTNHGLRTFYPKDKQLIGTLFETEPKRFKYLIATFEVIKGGQSEHIRVKAKFSGDRPTCK